MVDKHVWILPVNNRRITLVQFPQQDIYRKDQKWNNHKDWALSHGKSTERREKWKEILENSSEPCVLISACITNSWLGRNGFAKELGISIKELKEIESYKKEPTINQLRKISELSSIPMDYIYVPNIF